EPERPSQSIAEGGRRKAELKNNPQAAICNPQSLRGDLDNIVLMAMRKESERRYASVEQFAEDIRRHLEGLPVRARKDTFGYRAAKFVKRHKIGVAATGLMAVTLLAGVVATLWQARVARAERARAERRFNDVRQLANSFVFEFHDAIQNLPGSTPARALVVKRALEYLDSLAQEAGNDPSLQRELATAYEKLGMVQNTPTVAHLGDSAGAMQSHRKAAALREALVAGDSTNMDYQRELLDSYWHIAVLVNVEGDLLRAAEMIRQQLTMREKLLAADPTNLVDQYNQAGSYTHIGVVLLDMGDVAGALENQQRAMALREALMEIDPSRVRSQRALSISCEHLGFVTDKLGDTERSLDLQRRGLEIREALSAADSHNTDLKLMLVSSYEYLGDIFLKKGDIAEARKHYRRQLDICEELAAADPLSTQYRKNRATALIKIGDVQTQTGDARESLLSYRAALQMREALVAANAEDTFNRHDLAEAYVKSADALAMRGDIAEALENYRRGIEVYESLSAAAPAHVGIRSALANSYWKIGRLHTAIAQATKTPNSQEAEHWRAARERFQQSYGIRRDLSDRGISPAYGIDSSAGSPERIMEEIVRCDAALKKSQNALAATVGR
ncbi:MAG: tetratricopeptide repeat protein, partial [Acidobacteriota bacterium]|nr:tetratricopeptide repeat protein [Acidobacteriota bacterium]